MGCRPISRSGAALLSAMGGKLVDGGGAVYWIGCRRAERVLCRGGSTVKRPRPATALHPPPSVPACLSPLPTFACFCPPPQNTVRLWPPLTVSIHPPPRASVHIHPPLPALTRLHHTPNASARIPPFSARLRPPSPVSIRLHPVPFRGDDGPPTGASLGRSSVQNRRVWRGMGPFSGPRGGPPDRPRYRRPPAPTLWRNNRIERGRNSTRSTAGRRRNGGTAGALGCKMVIKCR